MVHEFKDGVCARCGCSQQALGEIGWECRSKKNKGAQTFRLGCAGVFSVIMIVAGVASICAAVFDWKETVYISPEVRVSAETARNTGLESGMVIPAMKYERDQTKKERDTYFFSGLLWTGLGIAILLNKYRAHKIGGKK